MKTKNLKYDRFIPIWRALENHYKNKRRWSIIERETDIPRRYFELLVQKIRNNEVNWLNYVDYNDFKEHLDEYTAFILSLKDKIY